MRDIIQQNPSLGTKRFTLRQICHRVSKLKNLVGISNTRVLFFNVTISRELDNGFPWISFLRPSEFKRIG
jgi:hypothetical protein